MGLLAANYSKHKYYTEKTNSNETTTVQGRQQQVDYIAEVINMSPSIFGSLLAQRGDGKGDPAEEPKISKETQAQIDDLNAQIDAKLKEVNVASIGDLDSAISASQSAQTKISGDIKTVEGELSGFNSKISSIDEQIAALNSSNDPDKQKKICNLEYQKTEANQALEAAKNKKTELEKQLNEEKINEAKLNTTKAEVNNIEHMILKLQQKELPKEVTYNVDTEKEDLASFSKVLKDFTTNPNENTAKALTKVYESGDNGVENLTAQRAYKSMVELYPQFFNKK